MNFLAAVLLLLGFSDEECFWGLVYLVETFCDGYHSVPRARKRNFLRARLLSIRVTKFGVTESNQFSLGCSFVDCSFLGAVKA